MKRTAWILTAAFAAIVMMGVGCGSKAETFGQPVTGDVQLVTSDQILSEPETFVGQSVRLEGEIIRECPTGCWFDMKDAGGMIHVDIKPSGLAIPQRIGKDVAVVGELHERDGQTVFIGRGVEIR